MFGPDPAASALVLPTRPLHQMYAEPARAFIEARGGEVRVNALARVTRRGQPGRRASKSAASRVAASQVIAAVPWFDLRRLFGAARRRHSRPILADADAMASMPIVTVNLWYDRRVMDDSFVGLPGREMQWVFDKRLAFGSNTSHLSLVSSGATRLTAMSRRRADRARRARSRRGTPGRPARPPHARDGRARETGDVLACARSAARGRRREPPSTGLYLAGDWIDTGLPGTIESAVVSGHRAADSAVGTATVNRR